MSKELHFEIFLKKNRKSGWALHDALKDRDDAIRKAHGLLREFKDGSVRVTKEKFDEAERKFRSVAIFEGGQDRYKIETENDAKASLPCLTPDDLSKPHARDTIRRSLTGWFERNKAIPMELLHRPDLVETLEASGTELQHAVQKIAVASAQDSDADVQTFVKQLNDLVQKGLKRIYKDQRDGRIPEYPKGKPFAEVAADIHASDSRAYTLRGAMADALKDKRSYGDKLDALLDMSEHLPEEEKAREFARTEVDGYLTDVIGFDAGRDALLGKCNDLGETVERLICLYDGDPHADAMSLAPSGARRMAKRIAAGELDECRSTIAQQLLKELERPKRLRPKSVREEVRLARELAQKLVTCAGQDLPLEQMSKAFTARSARLLQPETIDELLRFSNDANEEIERLLGLEENIVGDANKRKLAGYVRTALGSNKTDQYFVRGEGRPLERMSLMTSLQTRILRSKFCEEDKMDLAQMIDQLGMKIIDDTKILNAVEAGPQPALDKAAGLLKLATAGALPVGECRNDAQARALRQIKSEMGLKEAQAPDARDKLVNIQTMLQKLAS
ncbi:MAG: hypothetical protein QUV02_11800 [Maricaulis sp.]|uniref:hypothetical protein n=1 Tax=Maricaulis sp. TaxID=1486257 RepID=UPI0026097DFD|nr:hypothetical protein [Maricaulis sp.]MDM7985124.1 hypothetical protein [Maricaulis sp.]